MRRQRFSREQIAEADQRDILGVARELNLKLEKRKNTYKVPGYGGLYITPMKNAFHCFSADMSRGNRSEEHTSELQSRSDLCRRKRNRIFFTRAIR